MGDIKSDTLFDKYFTITKDGPVIFNGSKLVIVFPEKYLKKIATITNTTITTLGVYEGYIFDDMEEEDLEKASHKFISKIACEVTLTPSHIDTYNSIYEDPVSETMVKELFYKLVFLQGDVYMANTIATQSLTVMKSYLELLFGGSIPKSLSYDDIVKVWDRCNRSNGGGSLKVNISVLSSIVANLVRCPDDLSTQFRFKYDQYYKKGIKNGKLVRLFDAPKYTDSYSALTGADPKHGITVAISNTRMTGKEDEPIPIELAIQ